MIENPENYKSWIVYGVLTVTRGLFADTDSVKYSSTLVLNLDQRGKTEIPKVIKERSFKPILAALFIYDSNNWKVLAVR